jgi:arylsulfatase A-like enzyme
LRNAHERAAVRDPEWDQCYRTEIPVEAYPSTYVAEKTIEQLERCAASDSPFFIFCSFPDPHHPFTPPGSYWDLHDPGDVLLPTTFDHDHEDSPPHIRELIAARGRPGADPTMSWAPTEAQLRRAAAAEYGSIALIDERIGRVLEATDRLGLAERTNVFLTSDHGDLFGDHGLLLKHFVHYDGVMRVPLMARLPANPAACRTAGLVSSADLAPTILDLAQVEPYRGIQGRSLRPMLEGGSEILRDAVLIEEEQPFGLPGLSAPVRMRTLVTEEGRLTLYAGQAFGELYDRRTDPEERRNLWDASEGRDLRARLHEQLVREMAAVDDFGIRPLAGA